jgi:hypothetical protein
MMQIEAERLPLPSTGRVGRGRVRRAKRGTSR